jgi:hypothetical protein
VRGGLTLSIRLDTFEIEGRLRPNQRRVVLAYAHRRHAELLQNYESYQRDGSYFEIED